MTENKTKPNVIFLDVDGVLTAMDDTPGSYINHDPSEYGPSPSCIERLKKFCKEIDAKIIVSSNWRKHPDDGPCSFWTHNGVHGTRKIVQNPLPKVREQLKEWIVGYLPPIRHTTKAEALVLWFEESEISPDEINFVIFDDDLREDLDKTYEYHIKDHFILTNVQTGLTDDDIAKAREILRS